MLNTTDDRLRVLIADDNAINRKVIREMLRALTNALDEVDTGVAAVERMKTQTYDLVLMDVHMPEMDGLTAARVIRAAGETWSTTPMIAVTADAMRGDRERCLAAGLDGYVAKPVDMNTLFLEIGAVLAASAARRAA